MTEGAGPPGSRIFSLEDRPAPSLYLIGWIATAGGLATIAVALLSSSPGLGPIIAFVGLLVLGLGLAVSAGYQLVARSVRAPQAYRGPSPLILFGIVLCVATVASAILAFLGLDATRPFGFLINLAVIGLAYLGVVAMFVVVGGALRWSEMGWPAWRSGPRIGARRLVADMAYALAIIVPTTLAALIGAGILASILDVRPPAVLPDADTSVELLAVALAAVVLAPLGEELFFRGFALTAWWRDLGPNAALLRSSIFFAVVHIANVQAVTFREGLAQAAVQVAVILPLGLVIGALFRMRGMTSAITAHVGYNGLLLALYVAFESLRLPTA